MVGKGVCSVSLGCVELVAPRNRERDVQETIGNMGLDLRVNVLGVNSIVVGL